MYYSIVSIVSQNVVNFNEFSLYSIAFWLYYTHFVTSTAFFCTLETKVTVFSSDIINLFGFLPFLDNIVFVYVYQNFGKKKYLKFNFEKLIFWFEKLINFYFVIIF